MSEINRDVFDKLKARMKEKFPVLLEGYLRDAKSCLANIETHLPGGNCDEIINSAHSLKSASGLLGIRAVSQKAEKIEYDAKLLKENNDRNLEKLRPDCEALQNSFSAIEGELLTELSKAKSKSVY